VRGVPRDRESTRGDIGLDNLAYWSGMMAMVKITPPTKAVTGFVTVRMSIPAQSIARRSAVMAGALKMSPHFSMNESIPHCSPLRFKGS